LILELIDQLGITDHTQDKALDQADANGWLIVEIKKDWNTVFPKT
jgi:hypothetical protein